MVTEPGEVPRTVRCDASLTPSEEEKEESILDCRNPARLMRNH